MGLISYRIVRIGYTQRSWAQADVRFREGFVAGIRAALESGELVRLVGTDGASLEEIGR